MYFSNCKTVEELKRLYRKLAFENHPDRGGDAETMKRINAEYDEAFQRLKNHHESAQEAGEAYESQTETTEAPEDFRNIIDILLHLEGVEIELCGRWLWLSGNTYANREALKAAGCRWASKKKLWYWHPAEEVSRSHKSKDMKEIRERYGSARVSGYARPQCLAG